MASAKYSILGESLELLDRRATLFIEIAEENSAEAPEEEFFDLGNEEADREDKHEILDGIAEKITLDWGLGVTSFAYMYSHVLLKLTVRRTPIHQRFTSVRHCFC